MVASCSLDIAVLGLYVIDGTWFHMSWYLEMEINVYGEAEFVGRILEDFKEMRRVPGLSSGSRCAE